MASIREGQFTQDSLRARAKALGIGLHYKYDHHALHSCFDGNSNQWMLTYLWGAQSFLNLRAVAAELDKREERIARGKGPA